MSADIKNLRVRIKSVDSTLHLTKAMGLVASSKIRRANEAMANGREYFSSVEKIIDNLCADPECRVSPYMKRSGGAGAKIKIIVIAGDRGLCGGYNANMFRLMRGYTAEEIIPIGKRACERYKGGYDSAEHFSREQGYALAKRLCTEFRDGKYDRLGIAYSEYVSILTQKASMKWILPLEKKDGGRAGSILYEPDEVQILNSAVLEYVAAAIMSSVRESFACEAASRRMAMDSAGKNAQKMLADLRLDYNRARQGAITQEITEIVAGSGE